MASVVTTYVVCLKTGFEPVTSEISSPHAAAAPFQTYLYRLFFATVVAIPIPRVELGTQGYEPYVLPFHYIGLPFGYFCYNLRCLFKNWDRTSDLGDRSPRALPLRHFEHTCIGYFFVATIVAIPIPRVELGTQGYEPYVLPFHYIGLPLKGLLQLTLLIRQLDSNQ